MTRLQVYDPPMCCDTGVCGNSIDPKLVTFASDLEWLKKQNITVIRHGLSFEPEEFIKNEVVKSTLQKEGNECLPLIMINNQIVSKGCYPCREELAKICGIAWKDEYDEEEPGTVKIEACGPDCDCHDSPISDNTKKILFIIILTIMFLIIAVKMSCKATGAEYNIGEKNTPSQSSISINNKKSQSILGKYIEKTNQAESNKEVAFVFIPAKGDESISTSAKEAVLSSKKLLKKKKIKVSLFTLKTTSSDYPTIVSQVEVPSIMIINKGQGKGFASGEIDEANILQAYVASTLACNVCPCQKH